MSPNRKPSGSAKKSMLKTYSPSATNVCSTEMPPRVPGGAPSTRAICDAVFGSLKVACVAEPSGSPIASIAMRLAARR